MTASISVESQGVFNLFAGTVNPSPSIREQAENQLKQVKLLFQYSAFIIMCQYSLCRLVNKLGSVRFFYKLSVNPLDLLLRRIWGFIKLAPFTSKISLKNFG